MLPKYPRGGQDELLKLNQAEFFGDESEAEFEIRRPHGSPALYRWLLEEKFRRSLIGLGSFPLDAVALTVCGGSGMDAEFLCSKGFTVISTDISLGAARNAKTRASRYNLPLFPVVADVEKLPFRDRSFVLTYVHDGLHHLSDPYTGLEEMIRVTSEAVSLTEPADAVVTRLAVKLRMADEVEEAGNRVARLQSDKVAGTFLNQRFRITNADRYAMYYKHIPGRAFERLSGDLIFPFSVVAWRFINRIFGKVGNKMAVVAIREKD
jgi:ubiquinone/menaquinone biosynthesis C-methylase UbiE